MIKVTIVVEIDGDLRDVVRHIKSNLDRLEEMQPGERRRMLAHLDGHPLRGAASVGTMEIDDV
jgi:hypothetical protein